MWFTFIVALHFSLSIEIHGGINNISVEKVIGDIPVEKELAFCVIAVFVVMQSCVRPYPGPAHRYPTDYHELWHVPGGKQLL